MYKHKAGHLAAASEKQPRTHSDLIGVGGKTCVTGGEAGACRGDSDWAADCKGQLLQPRLGGGGRGGEEEKGEQKQQLGAAKQVPTWEEQGTTLPLWAPGPSGASP